METKICLSTTAPWKPTHNIVSARWNCVILQPKVVSNSPTEANSSQQFQSIPALLPNLATRPTVKSAARFTSPLLLSDTCSGSKHGSAFEHLWRWHSSTRLLARFLKEIVDRRTEPTPSVDACLLTNGTPQVRLQTCTRRRGVGKAGPLRSGGPNTRGGKRVAPS